LKLEIILICLYRMISRWHWGRLERLYNHFKLVLSCWRWLKHKECIFVDVSSSDNFLYIPCLGLFRVWYVRILCWLWCKSLLKTNWWTL